MIQWLKECSVKGMGDEDNCYSLDKLKSLYRVDKLIPDGWLVINDVNGWIYFAVVSFYQSETDHSGVIVQIVFHGEGAAGRLRECRHTWWGEDPGGFGAAFIALSKWCNDMRPPTFTRSWVKSPAERECPICGVPPLPEHPDFSNNGRPAYLRSGDMDWCNIDELSGRYLEQCCSVARCWWLDQTSEADSPTPDCPFQISLAWRDYHAARYSRMVAQAMAGK